MAGYQITQGMGWMLEQSGFDNSGRKTIIYTMWAEAMPNLLLNGTEIIAKACIVNTAGILLSIRLSVCKSTADPFIFVL